MDIMGQISRFAKLVEGVVAFDTMAALHLFKVGMIVAFAQPIQPVQPAYQLEESPMARMEHHLESNDARLDSLRDKVFSIDSRESTLEGGAEVSLGIIGALSILGFIRTPTRRQPDEKEKNVH